MKDRIAVGIDCRELTRRNIGSLGFILLFLLSELKEYSLILLSDVELKEEYVPSNAVAINRGKECTGGFDLLKYQLWMKKKLRENNADVLFQINHYALVSTKGIKQITVVHDLYPIEGFEKGNAVYKLIYKISLAATMINSNVIFTVSEFSKNRLEKFFWKSKKIHVNYNGVDDPQNEVGDLPVEKGYFLMLGRVCYWKRTVEFAQLFSKFLSPKGYRLVIAGMCDSEKIESRLRRITDADCNIIWLNYVSNEVREVLMRNASMFIYPTRYDGFGLPPLELAKRRIPVIMSDIPVLREVTKNKGVYIDFDDDETKIANEIIEAYENYSDDMLEALHDVAQSYTWESNISKVKECIDELCKR